MTTTVYNLVEDINETENRARYKTEIVKKLEKTLLQWWNTEVPDIEHAPNYSGQIHWKMPK